MKNNRFLTRRLAAAAVGLLALAWLPQASAIIIAENTHVDGQGAGNNHYSRVGWIGAENFTVVDDVLVTEISHVGHHTRGTAQPSAIDWWIYGDNSGAPGAIIASAMDAAYTTNVEGTSGSYDLTRYLVSVAVALTPGDYWVGFSNDSGGDPHWTFASAGTSFDGVSALSQNDGLSWSTPYPGTNMTFRVEGELRGVPEPTALLLLATGVAGFARRRRA